MDKTFQKSIVGAGLKLVGAYWIVEKIVAVLYLIIADPGINILLKTLPSAKDSDPHVGIRIWSFQYIAYFGLSIIFGVVLIFYSDVIADWLCRMVKSPKKLQNNVMHAISESDKDVSFKQKKCLKILLLTTIAFMFLFVLWLVPNNMRAWVIIVSLLAVISLMIKNYRNQHKTTQRPPPN